jgi:hypothetical protein
MRTRRLLGWFLSVVATALTVAGVTFAATSSNVGDSSALALGGHPPRTANLTMTIDTGNGVSMNGTGTIDFVHNAMDVELAVPLLITTVNLEVRVVNGHMYLGNAQVANLKSSSSRPWMDIGPRASSLDLTGLSLTMLKPSLGKLNDGTTVSHENGLTVYTKRQNSGGLRGMVKLFTESAGQVAGLFIQLDLKTAHLNITATVVNYNRTAHIAAPPASQVTTLPSQSSLQQILGGLGSGGGLLPSAAKILGGVAL